MNLSCLTFGSLKFSLDFLTRLGQEAIAKHNKKLAEKALREFGALGLLPEEITARKEHSTIFNVRGDDSLFRRLTNNHIVCAQRGGGIESRNN